MDQIQNGYEDEISLRELIETLLKRKKTIALITLACIILSGVYSFFILKPSYEATAMLRLNGFPVGLEDYTTQITNYDVLSSTIMDLNLQEQEIDTESLKKMIAIKRVEDTNLIEITVKNKDSDLAAQIANKIAVNSKAIAIPIYDKMLMKANENIRLIQKTLEASNRELAEASEFVILKKNLVDDPALNAILSQGNPGNGILSIELKSEEMNTRYIEIQRNIFANDLAMINKNEEVANIQTRLEAIKQEISGQSPMNTYKESYVVSKAIIPETPVSPRKVLNLAIGTVLGLMLGAFWAFFREYWENTGEQAPSETRREEAENPAHIA
jgi:capsular polysaccharide biosynthesis protein